MLTKLIQNDPRDFEAFNLRGHSAAWVKDALSNSKSERGFEQAFSFKYCHILKSSGLQSGLEASLHAG